MPYIKQYARNNLDDAIEQLYPTNEGELNYVLTKILHSYQERMGISYSTFNGMVGVLECAKMELYRRRIAPYEDIKIAENGDV